MSKKDKDRRADEVDFTIDPERVKDEYVRVPSFIATLNAVYAQAARKAIMAKFERDRVFAEVAQEIVDDADKKPAEAQIKQRVTLDKRYEAAVQAYADAEGAKQLAWGRSQAMIAKKEMLVSLGAHVRQELGGAGALESEDDEVAEHDEEDDRD